METRAEREERHPIANEDKGPRGPVVPTPEEEGDRYEAMNAMPAKAASAAKATSHQASSAALCLLVHDDAHLSRGHPLVHL